MADCPKCNNSIPWYKSITHTRWTGIKCSQCGTKSFVRRKDIYRWPLLAALTGGLIGGLIGRFSNINKIYSLSSLFLAISISSLVYLTIGWGKTKLEIRDRS